jgi:hypothetical protein
MAYFKGVLATLASLFLALLVPQLLWLIRVGGLEKGTGAAAFEGILLESVLSPWFWIPAIVFSLLFYAAGRSQNQGIRLAFFWIPVIVVSAGGFVLWALFALLARRFAPGQG